MIHRRRRRHRDKDAAELNITAFMNLMVVLVPFLLITAVFSRLAILELNLPTSQSAPSDTVEEPQFQLEITVRDSRIEVGDRNGGRLNQFENTAEGYALEDLSGFLREVKQRFPDKLDATLLLEPDISYDVLVQVMDAVRVAEVPAAQGVLTVKAELFPEISIGDAPRLN
jgi:biopolymer transport protein ExbD